MDKYNYSKYLKYKTKYLNLLITLHNHNQNLDYIY